MLAQRPLLGRGGPGDGRGRPRGLPDFTTRCKEGVLPWSKNALTRALEERGHRATPGQTPGFRGRWAALLLRRPDADRDQLQEITMARFASFTARPRPPAPARHPHMTIVLRIDGVDVAEKQVRGASHDAPAAATTTTPNGGTTTTKISPRWPRSGCAGAARAGSASRSATTAGPSLAGAP